MENRLGHYLQASTAGETYASYIPKPLPPEPSLDMGSIYPQLDQANLALGRLDGIAGVLPDQELFLYMYIRKEAVLSSQIEGTQSSLSDLLLYENKEAPGVPEHDVIEVSNYVAAMEHGFTRMKNGFPLSLRLIKEIHQTLLGKGRGSTKQPGEFRRSQNWIGGSRPSHATFVPPPPEKIMELLGQLELFIHNESCTLPTLIKAALIHVQFETIHPFLDGNGRLGRLLITFILCSEGILSKPLLYLSLYFKMNRQQYYEHLQLVRETGDWEAWIQFFLNGVIKTANQAVETAKMLINLLAEDRKDIKTLGRPAASVLLVHQYLEKHPVTDITKITKHCNISHPTATKSIQHLEQLGIVTEITGKTRHKIYCYQHYLAILNEEIY